MIQRAGRSARLSIAALVLVTLAACAGPSAPSPAAASAGPSTTDPTAQTVRSPLGVVSSAAVPATRVGARVLAEGGNAVDAAVATGFVLAVTEPGMSGIAGRASVVLRLPDGSTHGIDGLNEVPRGFAEGGSPGYDRAAVPGTLAALSRLLDEHGSWPLERVMAPAIRLADEGFVLTAAQAGRLAGAAEDLARHPGARGIFLRPDGRPYAEGDRLVQRDLARSLRAIAEEGPDVLYHGWIADSIAADMARNGGFVSRDDLALYEARPALQVEGTYRGRTIVSNFRPASGHAVIQALQTLEAFPENEALLADQATWAVLIGQAMHWAIQDRNSREGGEEADARRLTSIGHARDRAQGILIPPDSVRRPPTSAPGPKGLRHAAPVGDATTHFSVADSRGMVVSITQSLGPAYGSRVTTPGLGFLYATRLGSEPGSRPSSTIAPTLVLDPDGAPSMALGGAGDARIISAVIQVISRRLDHGLPLDEAVAAPRVHPAGPQALSVEEGPLGWARATITAMGIETEGSASGYFGRVHALEFLPSGIFGVAEPRWEGSAAAPLQGG